MARTIGPATNCGKKADKRREGERVALRREFTAIDVDRVADRLERIKADANRQD
jgi:hypothetical protein